MNIPAYYDVHPQMNDYYSGLDEPFYEACELPLNPCMDVSSGYEDPSYLPQWSDGIAAYPDAEKESYGAL